MDEKNIHKDHRKRVRERFIREGSLDNFEYHQIVELLLFYAIPRKDTNVLAHKLLMEYGSFHNLLNAKPEDLIKRCGLTENAAVLISMLPHILRRYLNSSWDRNRRMDNVKAAAYYFKSLLIGQPHESFYIICLDARYRLIKAVKISDGTPNQSYIYPDKVIDLALLHKAVFAVIGHNHPSGTMKPSNSDVVATEKIKIALETINVVLLDHIIICDDNYYSFSEKNLCRLKF